MPYNTPRLGAHLRLLREERGLMSKELADKAGLAPNHYSELENGRRRLTTAVLEKLAPGLGLATEELREKLREMAGTGDAQRGAEHVISHDSSVREDAPMLYGRSMNSRTPDFDALAAHLVAAMPREDVFRMLRELTAEGEAGDNAALRKARALLDLIPTTHPTTAVSGG
jgi:transcriptional regulator with XRE-family HTH domain